jgi:hypothetical protein
MIMSNCENCDYWTEVDEKSGLCHRYPPNAIAQLIPKGTAGVIGGPQQMVLEKMELMTWVRTLRNDFCGEFYNDLS